MDRVAFISLEEYLLTDLFIPSDNGDQELKSLDEIATDINIIFLLLESYGLSQAEIHSTARNLFKAVKARAYPSTMIPDDLSRTDWEYVFKPHYRTTAEAALEQAEEAGAK